VRKKEGSGILISSGIELAIITIAVIYLIAKIYLFWLADTKFAYGSNLAKVNDYLGAYQNYQQAINLNPNEPLYHSEMSFSLAALSVIAFEGEETTVSAELLNTALKESQKAFKTSPENVSFYKTRTKMLHLLSAVNLHYNQEAISTLLVAFELAPTDAKIAYNLGLLYEIEKDSKKAEEYYKRAVALKPNYQDAYFSLANFYWEEGKKDKAINNLQYILEKINPKDSAVREKLKDWGVHEEGDSL